MAEPLADALVLETPQLVYAQRHPRKVLHHSGRGRTYIAAAFSDRCLGRGLTRSMGSVDDRFSTAMVKVVSCSLEIDGLARNHFATREETRRKVFARPEGWHSPRR